MAVAILGTSSIHVKLDEGEASGSDFELHVTRTDGSHLADFVISKENPYRFLPFWFSRPGEINFELQKPGGFDAEKRYLGIGRSVHLAIPGDFQPKKLRVLRLVPGWGLLEVIPTTKLDPNTSCEPGENRPRHCLSIDVYRDQAKLKHYSTPLSFQPIYIGASKPDLEMIARKEASGGWIKFLEADGEILQQEARALLQQLSQSEPLYLETVDLQPGDYVEFSYNFNDSGSIEDPKPLGSWKVVDQPEPRTLILNLPQ